MQEACWPKPRVGGRECRLSPGQSGAQSTAVWLLDRLCRRFAEPHGPGLSPLWARPSPLVNQGVPTPNQRCQGGPSPGARLPVFLSSATSARGSALGTPLPVNSICRRLEIAALGLDDGLCVTRAQTHAGSLLPPPGCLL